MNTPDPLLNDRRELMTLAGLTLLSIQYLECIICASVLMLKDHNLRFSVEAFLSEDPAKSGPSLGELILGLSSVVDLPPDFGTRLKTFKDNRNRFTHRLFAAEGQTVTEHVYIETRYKFMKELLEESEALQSVFLSFISIVAKKTGEAAPQYELARSYSKWDTQGEFLLKSIKALKKKS